MPIKNNKLKMDPFTEKIIVNYISCPEMKRDLIQRKLSACDKESLQNGYFSVKRIYDQIDVALLAMPPDLYKGLMLRYAEGFTYKALITEFKYSFPYVRNLIRQGLNEIFSRLDKEELSIVKDFFQGK